MSEERIDSAGNAEGDGASDNAKSKKKSKVSHLKLVPKDPATKDASDSKWTSLLHTSPSGVRKPILLNVLTALRKSPVWDGAFRYNAFSLLIEVIKPPPWVKDEARESFQVRPWTDHDDRLLCEWMQRKHIFVTVPVCVEAIFTVAKERSYHPVQEYLSGLKWDRMSRLNSWLHKYLGAEDSEYHSAVGKRWMISGIARIMAPGPDCKADCTLVLQGLQGTGKSSALQLLAGGKWFTDEVRRLGTKDAAMGLSGRWIVELAELSALGDVTLETVKAFLSQTMDRYRPPYGRYVTDNVRQCIFAATTNKENFLKDETGDRRWWPVKTGVLDLVGLKRDRDQLWAEAYELYRAGHAWWLDTSELRRLAEKAQAERFDEDPWEASILRWMERKKPTELTVEEVLKGAIGILPEEANRSHRNRVSSILRFHKWERTNERSNKQARLWRLTKQL